MRDLATARVLVVAVAYRIFATELGEAMVGRFELQMALEAAVGDVADLLDPDETFDAVVEWETDGRGSAEGESEPSAPDAHV